jgi:hypothetical protein
MYCIVLPQVPRTSYHPPNTAGVVHINGVGSGANTVPGQRGHLRLSYEWSPQPVIEEEVLNAWKGLKPRPTASLRSVSQRAFVSHRQYPFRTVYAPLRSSGNPGVSGQSHRGGAPRETLGAGQAVGHMGKVRRAVRRALASQKPPTPAGVVRDRFRTAIRTVIKRR